MGCYKNKPFLMAVRILVILTAILIISGCGKDKKSEDENGISVGEAVLYLNDETVTKEEYEMLAKEYCNQVYMNYTTDQVNSANFWEKEVDHTVPYVLLSDIIREKLQYNYTLKNLAVELDLTEDYTYDQLMNNMDKENEERSGQFEQENTVYGLSDFDNSTYYKYWYSGLETQIREKLIQKNIKITEQQCEDYYNNHREEFCYSVGVSIIYAEIAMESGEEKEQAWEKADDVYREMETAEDSRTLLEKFQDVHIENLDLNSIDTQEGASGVYTQRWNIASEMEEGQICRPYEQNGSICIIKCIKRTENDIIDFEAVKERIERYLQVQEADKKIEEKMENMKIQEGEISEKEVILETVSSNDNTAQ